MRGAILYLSLIFVLILPLAAARLEKWIESHLDRISRSGQASQEVLDCLERVIEWLEKYPDVSFRHSEYGRELLAKLYQAEKRNSEFRHSKKMNPIIIELILFYWKPIRTMTHRLT